MVSILSAGWSPKMQSKTLTEELHIQGVFKAASDGLNGWHWAGGSVTVHFNLYHFSTPKP